MKIDNLKREKKKTEESIEKLKERVRSLDKEIEKLNMEEIYKETIRFGAKDVNELRKLLSTAKKENEMILKEGAVNEA